MNLLDLFPPILDLVSEEPAPRGPACAVHSGNIGDVVYSLPTAFSLMAGHYILNICSDPGFGGRVMTREAALKLAPLLLGQGTIRRVSVIQSQVPLEYAEPARIGVDYVLDSFRANPVEPRYHLVHKHAFPFGIRVDGAPRWLHSEAEREDDLPAGIRKPYLVVGLTSRYRRWGDEYYASLLRDVPAERIIVVGVEADLIHKTNIAGAFLKPADFRQLARVLAGSALFIGNPSFPYALAEALKVPRMVELSDTINVAPLDPSGIPLHLYSENSLRERIFDAIQIAPHEWVALPDQIRDLTSRLAEMEVQKKAMESRLAEMGVQKGAVESRLVEMEVQKKAMESRLAELDRCLLDGREATNRVVAERIELIWRLDHLHRRVESPAFLLKSLFRRGMMSNRFTGKIHRSLSRITPLRRVWQNLGRI
jgi:hypothetical protein